MNLESATPGKAQNDSVGLRRVIPHVPLIGTGRALGGLAIILALAIGLMFLLPDGLLQAQETSRKTVAYTENDTIPVLTLSARDPEGAGPIVWSLVEAAITDAVATGEFEDHASFNISQSGVLTFKTKPDFEAASDSGDDSYKVVVQASDGGESSYFKVTVNVQDVEEEGSVKLSHQTGATLLQPQVRVTITAHTLTDPDGNASTARGNNDIDEATATWQWYRSSSKTARGTAIDAPAGIAATYTPVAGDVNLYLRVVATYDDGRGDGKTAEAVSEYPTIARIASNTAPEFSTVSTIRAVLEGADKGTNIGAPVTATDDESAEQLTYWLTGVDAARFNIDAMTGQLKVNTKLDHEGTTTSGEGINQCATANACVVTVNVADSSAANTGSIAVTINVIDVDEKPTFTGQKTIESPEATTTLDIDLSNTAADPAIYTATDPEEGSVTLSLSGVDASKFELKDPDPAAAGSKVLAFKDKPDFEMPGDSNRDNVYQVTVEAFDGAKSATRDVAVKVTNIEEDGKFNVMPRQPRVGTEMTATLTDPDSVIDPTWKWRRAETTNPTDACSTITDWTPDTTLIKDADSATYTPVSDDDGYCLRVEVSYLDTTYDATDLFAESVDLALPDKVQGPAENVAPMFDGTRTTRYMPENANAAAAAAVGAPVKAKDDDNDTLIYELGGADKAMFTIDQTTDGNASPPTMEGQIRVKATAKLDHETKPTLTVTVTATDPRGASDTITVTINVTDVDEMPEITVGGLVISGLSSVSLPEGSMTTVGSYTAAGPNAASASWTLEGDDAGDFMLAGSGTSRTLSFASSPDYENAADADADNTYMVTLKADDGTYMDMRTVTVMVMNVEEDGTVMLSSSQPVVGVELTASVTDLDGNVSGEMWQWASENSDGTYTDITGATSTAYTPMPADDDKRLRATVTYTDGYGADEAMETSANAVIAGDPLLIRYDADDDGYIQLDEARSAVGDYFKTPRGSVLSLEDARKIVGMYFEYRRMQGQ